MAFKDWKIWKIIGDIGKHGMRSKYLDDLHDFIDPLAAKHTGSELTPAELQSIELEQNFNANEAEKARAFEKEMSDTAYQRQVADMQKAGVNPALMYGNGSSGASTPSGNAASSSVSMPGMFDLLDKVMQMTMQGKQLKMQEKIAKINQQTSIDTAKIGAEASKYGADQQRATGAEANQIRAKEVAANVGLIAEQTKNEEKRGILLDIQKRIDNATATQQEALANYADQYAAAKSVKDQYDALSAALEYGLKEGLYTDEYVDALVNTAIFNSIEAKYSADEAKYAARSANLDSYFKVVKACLLNRSIPGPYTLLNADGKPWLTLDGMPKDIADSVSTGLGYKGPNDNSYRMSAGIGKFDTSQSSSTRVNL